ncbi:MAG: LysR family transcriptional regulator [Betaproteobacteria bacterium]|nr:LysR family transcriptional regulator [Betaproteobacteria bacterium]
MPSLKQIRYFLTVADLGSFTSAAVALFVAQPALSRQVAQLEEELGFALFEREARGVSLTPAGAIYRDRVIAIEHLLSAAAEEGEQLASGEAGVLRLLHSSSIPASSLLAVIQHFLQTCPKAHIDLDRIASEMQVTEVASGKADIGIIRLPVLRRDARVRFIELPAERLWVALPAAHALANRDSLGMNDLQQQVFVSAVHRERGGLARLVTDLCLRQGFVPRTARVVSRKTSMLNLVAAGLGIAVIPERMRTLDMTGIAFRPLHDPEAIALSALVLPQRPTPLAQSFADLMTQATAA